MKRGERTARAVSAMRCEMLGRQITTLRNVAYNIGVELDGIRREIERLEQERKMESAQWNPKSSDGAPKA